MKVNFNSLDEYTDYVKDNGVEIASAILKCIEKAIKENEKEALLFEIYFAGQDFVYEVTIDQPDWQDSLERCIDIFTKNNESDLAIDAHEVKGFVEELLDLKETS